MCSRINKASKYLRTKRRRNSRVERKYCLGRNTQSNFSFFTREVVLEEWPNIISTNMHYSFKKKSRLRRFCRRFARLKWIWKLKVSLKHSLVVVLRLSWMAQLAMN